MALLHQRLASFYVRRTTRVRAGGGGITGTPTTAGPFLERYRVRDSIGATVTKDLTINVNPPLMIVTTSLPNGQTCPGIPYLTSAGGRVTLSASGGTQRYTWSIVGDFPPAPGLSLSSGGAITGTPAIQDTYSQTYTQTYRVQDSNGAAVTTTLDIVVRCPPLG